MDEDDDSGRRYVTCVFVDPSNGEIYIVTVTGKRGGTITTARVVSREKRPCSVANRRRWNPGHVNYRRNALARGLGDLKRFENGKWKSVLPLPDARQPPIAHQQTPLALARQASLHLVATRSTVPRRKPATDARSSSAKPRSCCQTSRRNPVVERLAAPVDRPRPELFDAPQESHESQLPGAPDLLTSWPGGLAASAGGDHGLWLVDPAEKTLHSIDRVPTIKHNKVFSLAPDPHHDDGMIAALGPRGVAFLRPAETMTPATHSRLSLRESASSTKVAFRSAKVRLPPKSTFAPRRIIFHHAFWSARTPASFERHLRKRSSSALHSSSVRRFTLTYSTRSFLSSAQCAIPFAVTGAP